MTRADAREPAGLDLAPLGNARDQHPDILVVDVGDLVDAETTDPLASKHATPRPVGLWFASPRASAPHSRTSDVSCVASVVPASATAAGGGPAAGGAASPVPASAPAADPSAAGASSRSGNGGLPPRRATTLYCRFSFSRPRAGLFAGPRRHARSDDAALGPAPAAGGPTLRSSRRARRAAGPHRFPSVKCPISYASFRRPQTSVFSTVPPNSLTRSATCVCSASTSSSLAVGATM